MVVNSITGLKEEWHERLGVPVVMQRSITQVKFSGQARAVHHIPIGEGLVLKAYGKFVKSEALVIVLSSHFPNEKHLQPYELDALGLRNQKFSILVIEDPTLTAYPGIEKGWFLGGPDFDPIELVGKIVKKAIAKCGSHQIVFAGRGEGGFAALKLSALHPESSAYVDSPDIFVNDSNPHKYVEEYFNKVHPSMNRLEILRSNLSKYSISEMYRTFVPQNLMILDQDFSETRKMIKQYRTFKNMYLVKDAQGVDFTLRKQFRLYDPDFSRPKEINRIRFHNGLIESLSEFKKMSANIKNGMDRNMIEDDKS